ncbi:c-type lectin receptor-like tyrosine-protein kinase, partial [Trifolium pratense]
MSKLLVSDVMIRVIFEGNLLLVPFFSHPLSAPYFVEVVAMELNPTLLQFLLLLFAVAAFTSTATLNETCGHLDGSFNRDTKAPCPNGWVMDPNKTKCFLHVGRPQSWNDSETCCNKYGGHLASLASLQELHFAQSLCGESINSCWIGGRRLNNTISGFQWTWSDNSQWNKSMFPLANVPLNCTGTGQSCVRNITENVCSVMTNNSKSLISERCDNPHASLCILDIDAKCNHMHCHRDYLIILAVVSGLILSTTFAVVVWLLVYKRGKKRRRSRKLTDPAASLPSWKVFTKEELRSITKNFSEGNRLVGDAKTGGTYSGVQPDGSKVAVKRLKRSSFKRKKEFYSEIGRVARLRHPNLVVVMGCCYDHGDRYIVYEFVANGPLDKWLHHIPRGGRSLDWAMRMKIATTLAQGIASLSLHRCSLYAFLTISTARPLATLANLKRGLYVFLSPQAKDLVPQAKKVVPRAKIAAG